MADPWNLQGMLAGAAAQARRAGRGAPLGNGQPASTGYDPFGLQNFVNGANTAAQGAYGFDQLVKDQLKQGRTPIEYDTQYQDQSRALQQQMIQDAHKLAAGDMNSYAQQQLRQGTQTAQGQAAGSMAARGNFGGAGAGMRFAGQAQGAIGRQGQDAAQVLKLQEQQAAQALLAQMYAQQHGQDAGLANDLAQTNMRNYGLDNANTRYFSQLGQQGAIQRGQNDVNSMLATLGLQAQQDKINAGWRDMAMNAGGTAFGTVMGMDWGGGGDSYRQVGGQNSIVPDWDK